MKEFILILTALFGIRAYSLIINNLLDINIDRANPRTANRPLPSGCVSVIEAITLGILSLILYFISAALLNYYALLLSPIFPILSTIYPLLKRCCPIAHFWLGAILGSSVIGGSIAVSGDAPTLIDALGRVPWIYVISVWLWVASFDSIYAIEDIEFDRKYGLHSVPADYGIEKTKAIVEFSSLIFSALMIWSMKVYSLNVFSSLLMAYGLGTYWKLIGMLELDPYEAASKSLNVNVKVGVALGVAPLLKLLPLM
ncbi:prenyltransferase [Ignicoccus islandicus DSM 13165]|uniref:Prenyltransferase n=1 Tax=Ignicoccus islandicus DSM 13165 TaxID=940295 RepID=A0A0U2VD85_9CREN|nr:prenyltransferase [Ignicoccus islandicus DSM 13165]